MNYVLLSALALGTAFGAAGAAAPDIYVAYPPDKYTVAFDRVLFEGSVPPGATLSVDGRALDVGPDGLFIEWLPLRPGANVLKLESSLNGEKALREFTVTSTPPAPLAARPTAIVPGSVAPGSDLRLFGLWGSLSARTVAVSFRGSPNGAASFRIGDRGPFPMLERKAENFPGGAPQPGVYEGTLVLRDGETLADLPITVSLVGEDGQTVTATAVGKLGVAAGQPRVGIFSGPEVGVAVNAGTTVARNGPGRNYIVYPKIGMKFVVTGEEGNTYRALLAPNQTVNLLKTQVRLLPEGAPLPRAYFTRIDTRRTENATQVRLNLPDRLPFTVEQTVGEGGQTLDLRVYGAESDVDYIVSAFPDETIRDVRWVQEQDGVFRARVELAGRQPWGYSTFYDGNTLVLSVKRPPVLNAATLNGPRPLAGRKILVDPGHGGNESGAAGALRVNEKDLTLAISLKLAEKLRALGATVVLSRDADATVPLYDRALLAEKENVDLLLSVHGNALPDGADPALSRGAGAYYYHPQARPLADALLASVLRAVPEVGSDGAHYQNLALTRPTGQLSVLFETAFLTDKGNLRLLMSPGGQERFAEGLARGVVDFYRAQAR